MKLPFIGKKKEDSDDQAKKVVENKKEDLTQVATGNVKIKVFMTFGGSVNTLKDEFEAKEIRDGAGGLVFFNEDKQFIEDVDFEKNDVFANLKVMLEIKEKNHSEQLNILDKKIIKQKKIIAYLLKHEKLNAVYNFCDEELKLRDLQILRGHIANIDEKQGSFYTLENGMRTFSFLKKDGFFYPIWHGVDHFSTYPDYIRKKKIHTAEAKIFEKEWHNKLKRALEPMTLIAVLIILVVLSGLLIWGVIKVMDKSSEMDNQINNQALKCTEYTSALNIQIASLFKNKCIDMLMQEENLTRVEIADKYVPAIKDISPKKQ